MADHPTTKSRRQVGFLLSSGSPLSPGQKSKLKGELNEGTVRVKGSHMSHEGAPIKLNMPVRALRDGQTGKHFLSPLGDKNRTPISGQRFTSPADARAAAKKHNEAFRKQRRQ